MPEDTPDSPLEVQGNDFWDLIKQLVALVYHTDPDERLGVVVPFLEEAYGRDESSKARYRRIETTVLRIVAWMETLKDVDLNDDWP